LILKKNGSALVDAEQERKMAITNEEVLNGATKHVGKRKNQAKRQRSSSPSESIRYFVGKPGGAKPSLDQEVPGEAEGLVIGFKTDARLFVVHEYEVGQKIERGRVCLEKTPAAGSQRVSTTNES
jgi:hypothetical protein